MLLRWCLNNCGELPEEILSLITEYNDSLGTYNIGISVVEEEDDEIVDDSRSEIEEIKAKHIEELRLLKEQLLEKQALIEQLQRENAGYRERETQIKRVLSI